MAPYTTLDGQRGSWALEKDVYRFTRAVRMYGSPDGDIQNIGYDFLWESDWSITDASAYYLYWYQQFYNDRATRQLPPLENRISNRPPSPNDATWAREQMQVIAPTPIAATSSIAEILYYDVRRKTPFNTNVSGRGHAFYVPVTNHAMYVRLGLAISSTSTGFDNPAYLAEHNRLRVWAIVGGHDQQTAQEIDSGVYAGEAP